MGLHQFRCSYGVKNVWYTYDEVDDGVQDSHGPRSAEENPKKKWQDEKAENPEGHEQRHGKLKIEEEEIVVMKKTK